MAGTKIPRSRLAALMADKLDSGSNGAELAKELAAYLLTEGRSSELDSLLRDIMQIRSDRGIVEVIARTSHPLDAAVRESIKAEVRVLFPEAKTIIISEVHDVSVVGGVRLEFANQQLDLSIRAKLNRFKQLTTA